MSWIIEDCSPDKIIHFHSINKWKKCFFQGAGIAPLTFVSRDHIIELFV